MPKQTTVHLHRNNARCRGSTIATFTFAFGTVILLALFNAAPTNAARVMVRKCCPFGQEFRLIERQDERDNTAIIESRSCEVSNVTNWVPPIKFRKRDGFFQPLGEAPKFMGFVENSLPLDKCQDPLSAIGEHSVVLVADGSLVVSERALLIANDHFCIDRNSALFCPPVPQDIRHGNELVSDSGNSIHISGGHAPLVDDRGNKWRRKMTTIRKCCGPRSAYNSNQTTCINLSEHNPLNQKPVFNGSQLSVTKLDLLYGFPTTCASSNFVILGQFKADMFVEERNVIKLEDSHRELGENEFCLEHNVAQEDNMTYSSFVNVFACAEFFTTDGSGGQPQLNKIKTDVRFQLYAIGLLISVVFLSATLIVSFLVPSNHHVLHWRCQTYYVVCLLIGDLLLAITQLGSLSGPFCAVTATLMHFFFLAAFFWLNTMCFNIWWTFRDFRPTSLEKGQELCRLRLYELYAWGFPILFASIAAILDNLPDTAANKGFLRPRFGEEKCWFYGDLEILTYFFGPIGILLVINILLFVSTTRQLTCGLWKRDDVKSTSERAALGRVCMKLVIVMGITWIADVISWAIGGPHYLWYVTDFINAIQGVFIFFVVGCQPQIWAAVKRLWNSKSERNMNNTTNGPQHSSSSHGLPSMGADSITNNTFTNSANLNNNYSIHSGTTTTTTAASATGGKIPLETVC